MHFGARVCPCFGDSFFAEFHIFSPYEKWVFSLDGKSVLTTKVAVQNRVSVYCSSESLHNHHGNNWRAMHHARYNPVARLLPFNVFDSVFGHQLPSCSASERLTVIISFCPLSAISITSVIIKLSIAARDHVWHWLCGRRGVFVLIWSFLDVARAY